MANFGNQGGKQPTRIRGAGGRAPVPQIAAMEISEPRCKVCTSQHRREIDMMLVSGWSQTEVIDHWNMVLGSDVFNKSNMSRHKQKHLNIHDKAVRRIIEEKARAIGVDIETAKDFILTKEGAIQLVVHNALQNMLSGNTTAEPQDLLKAIDTLGKLEAESREVAVDEMLRDYQAFSLAVQDVLEEIAPLVGKDKEELMAEVGRRYEMKLDENRPILELTESAEVIDEND